MELRTNKRYRLSKNGGATQVILFCHGGWSTSDGHVTVPSGMVINFYSAHGQFGTKSQVLAESLLGAQSSNDGLDQATLMTLMRQMEAQRWTPEQLDQAILDAKANANAQDMAQSMQVYESVAGGGRFRNRQRVYDYALSYSGPRDSEQSMENLLVQHQNGMLSQDIDLLVMKPGKTGHLKSAMSFARSKGESYSQFHFLPCRYVDASDEKSMRTVVLPDFGDEDFIETSVL